jgi:hypothetical protein
MKGITIMIFVWMIVFVSGCTKIEEYRAEKVIYFDSHKCVKDFDLKNITDSAFLIIPIETNENSLVSNIDKLEIHNNRIYIMDKLAQSVYIYDMDGKYLDRIRAIGQGPGEYANLSYMTVTDSSIIVLDHFMGKQIEYRLSSLKFVKEERIFDEIWCTELFTLSGHVYYVNSWSNSQVGKFRLFSRKSSEKKFNKYLPFDERPLSLGITGPVYAINGNEVSLTYDGDDIIYRINDKGVFPEYEVKFKDKKAVYSSEKVENVFQNNPDGRILGVNAINESDKYLFLDVTATGQNRYTCIYNKNDSTTIIYDGVAVNSTFDNEQIVINKIIDNKIISWREAESLLIQKKYLYAHKTFNNKAFENRLTEVLANLKEDDNPVLFIYDLK